MKENLEHQNTRAKLYVPKELRNGRKVPSVSPGARWYVYFRYRNPITQKLELKKYKKGINIYKTVKDRKYHGEIVVTAFNHLLDNGWSPFGIESPFLSHKLPETITEALDYCIEKKKNDWKEGTLNNHKINANVFKRWLVDERKDFLPLESFEFEDALAFINHLTTNKNITGTTVHNYRRSLRTMFNVLKQDRLITENFFESIETKPSKEVVHKSFNNDQVKAIKEYLVENDMQLYYFINFMMYSFLRNREVLKLKVESIDLDNDVISVNTKTEALSRKLLHPKLKEILINDFNIKGKPLDHFIITEETGVTGFWDADIKRKLRVFSNRFIKVRKALNLSDEYTIYSFRHTFITNIYVNLRKDGQNEHEAIMKLMSITGHYSIPALKKYLRTIGAILPKRYDQYTTIDF